MSATTPNPDQLTNQLFVNGLHYIPVRHHSPSCARQLQRYIEQLKPAAVLVEGPIELNPLLPLILHPKTRMPTAAYVLVDGNNDTTPSGSAFYPFCDYSPELLALQSGQAMGAELAFIDLPYAEQIKAESHQVNGGDKVHSLLAESHFKHNRYLDALAQKQGCRDHNELWDHLFELQHHSLAPQDYFKAVAAYCYMARQDYSTEALEADGTLARERFMVQQILRWQEQVDGDIVIVTGGFHTAWLPQLLKTSKARKRLPSGKDTRSWLLRFSFDQLDALNGYGAGMPSPGYYQRLWQQNHQWQQTAADILVELGRLSRDRNLSTTVSTADCSAALAQANGLAQLRGHPGPGREDLLDAIRSCYLKGADADVLLSVVQELLRGRQLGVVPAEADLPPLVQDFQQRCQRAKLNIDDSVQRELSLDIYRKPSDRQRSQLLHALAYIGSPFARRLAGPDFAHGVALERRHEQWQYGWSPAVEAHLLEQSIHGANLQQLCLHRLQQNIAALSDQGQGRSASTAVKLLTQALQIGLQDLLAELIDTIAQHLHEDASFGSLTSSLVQLHLLEQAWEPLQLGSDHALQALIPLQILAWQRACAQLPEIHGCNTEQLNANLQALNQLRECRSSPTLQVRLDISLYQQALSQLSLLALQQTALKGMADALLYSDALLTEQQLSHRCSQQLQSALSNPASQVGYLHGLLYGCRQLIWQLPELLQHLDDLLQSWDEQQFQQLLPQLRLTFAELTPKETDRTAAQIANLHGVQELGDLQHHTSLEQARQHSALTAAVNAQLQTDGLTEWLQQ